MEITGIIETCLYSEELLPLKHFYERLPGVNLIAEEKGRHLFFKCGFQMLLIFDSNHTSVEQTEVNGKRIPLHGAKGAILIAFSVQNNTIDQWKSLMKRKSIPIESDVTWSNGSVSIYFRDPAGNSLEIVEQGLWD